VELAFFIDRASPLINKKVITMSADHNITKCYDIVTAPDGSVNNLNWTSQVITIEQYERLYGKIPIGMFKLTASFRVWKKILLMIDPSMPTWRKKPGSDTCHFAEILDYIIEFGVAELIIPAGATVYHDSMYEDVIPRRAKYYYDANSTAIHELPRHFRTNIAQVVKITDGCGIDVKRAKSIYGRAHAYSPDDIDYIVEECVMPGQQMAPPEAGLFASGIHFTDTLENAWNV
jgi:hypothetical protein